MPEGQAYLKNRKRLPIAQLIPLGVFLLLGCSPFVDRDQTAVVPEVTVVVEPGHTVGQTFVARHGGLNGVEFWLEPQPGSEGRIRLRLRADPQSAVDLAEAVLSLDQITAPGFYRFSFAPDNRSHSVYRYVFLELEGVGGVRVGAASGEAYLDGAAYRDHEPLDAQLAFRLVYDPMGILIDLMLMVAGWIGYGFLGIVVLFLAGYWIVRRWAHRSGADFTAMLITSVVSALALWMLLLVWSALFGIRLDMWIVRLLTGVAVLVGLLFFIKDRQQWNRAFWLGEDPFATLALWLVVACSVGLRLWIGRGLVMLPGSDAYHHTLIVQLFAEQGGIPNNYDPYAPLQSFSYHFGFHSLVALFRWLLGSDLLSTTKVMALILNGGIAATVGLFSEQIAGHRRAGVVAAGLVGLIMVSPFCLLRWSRFTQTAGLFFLPVALLMLVWEKRETGRMFPALLVAALFFAHLRVALMLGIFAIITAGMAILQRRNDSFRQVVAIEIISIILASPWLLRVLWVQYDPYGLRITYPFLTGYNDIQRLEEVVLHFVTNWSVLFFILMLTIVACFGRRQLIVLELVIWCVVLIGGALLSAKVSFSFWDLITTLLSLPIPFSGLAGLGIQSLYNMFGGLWRSVVHRMLVIYFIIGIVSASLAFPKLIYTGNIYVRPSDLIAMKWVNDNLPADAVFAVDALQFAWSPGWMVGSDSGYWIPLLGHRKSVILPMIYFIEWVNPSAARRIERVYHVINSLRYGVVDSQCEMIKNLGATHIFLSSRSSTYMSFVLAKKACLRLRYQQDRIRIFEVIQ